METDEEQEIMAEDSGQQQLAFSSVIGTVVQHAERYGWIILAVSICVYIMWSRWVRPAMVEASKRRKLGNANELYEQQAKVLAARERLQQQYIADAQRQQAKVDEMKLLKAQQDAEEWERLKRGLGYKNKGGAKMPKPSTSMDPRVFVENLIKSKPVVVFSKSSCPFCHKAKQALSTYRIDADRYEVVELDELPEGNRIQDELERITGVRSVPRVFIGGRCIGGGDDVVAVHRSGALTRALRDARAID